MSRSNTVFAPVVMAVLLTCMAGPVALITWGAAGRYLPELNIESPDIAKHEPVIGPTSEQKSRRVVLIIIDGWLPVALVVLSVLCTCPPCSLSTSILTTSTLPSLAAQ